DADVVADPALLAHHDVMPGLEAVADRRASVDHRAAAQPGVAPEDDRPCPEAVAGVADRHAGVDEGVVGERLLGGGPRRVCHGRNARAAALTSSHTVATCSGRRWG